MPRRTMPHRTAARTGDVNPVLGSLQISYHPPMREEDDQRRGKEERQMKGEVWVIKIFIMFNIWHICVCEKHRVVSRHEKSDVFPLFFVTLKAFY